MIITFLEVKNLDPCTTTQYMHGYDALDANYSLLCLHEITNPLWWKP